MAGLGIRNSQYVYAISYILALDKFTLDAVILQSPVMNCIQSPRNAHRYTVFRAGGLKLKSEVTGVAGR